MKKTSWVVALFLLQVVCLAGSRAWAQSGITEKNGRNVTCASDDGRRHLCRVNTSRGVQMVNQRSGSPCIQGQTWGITPRGIWVDRGCRADFFLGSPNQGYQPGPGSGPGPGYGPGPGNGQGPGGAIVTCSSNNGKRNFCQVDTGRGVQLVNQRSGSPCIQGQTWGYDGRSIWVDRGCRADFRVGR